MAELNDVLSRLFSSPAALFLSSVSFTVASFHWVHKLVADFHVKAWHMLAAGVCNGSIAVVTEFLVDRPAPFAMMAFVPLVTVLELRLVSRDRAWVYLFVFAAFLLNFSAIHDLMVAVMGLWPAHVPWDPSALEYRISIFTLALLTATGMLALLKRFMLAEELFSLIHSRQKSTILLVYMLASGGVMILASWVTVPVLFRGDIPAEISVPVHLDLVLKDSLLLACGYMITLFQCRAERFLKKSDVLNGELRKEKNFRTALQKRAVLNYIANLDQNRIVEGLEKFSPRLSQGLQGGHREILERFIQACVHPQDQEALRAQLLFPAPEHQGEGSEVQTVRARISAPLFQENIRLPEGGEPEQGTNGPWRWLEAQVTLVAGAEGRLAYVSLVDVDAEVAQDIQLQRAAQTDPLTGLLNRGALEQGVRRYLAGESACGALFMVDMDDFKKVNDRFGHAAGDALLREVARAIRGVFRAEDLLGRIGGDEFCLFAAGLQERVALAQRAEQLLEAVHRVRIPEAKDAFQVTLSVGAAACPEFGREYETLYERADIALYQAKCQEKNTICFYTGQKRSEYHGERAALPGKRRP